MKFLKKIDHIGIVVEDLQGAMADFSDRLGLECDEQIALEGAGIRMAFYSLGGGQVELIEFQKPIDGVDSIVTCPGKGVQHLAFQVDDIHGAITEMTKKGMKLVKGFPRKGAHGLVGCFYRSNGWVLIVEEGRRVDDKPKE